MQLEQDIPPSCRLRVCLHGPLEVWKRSTDGSWKPVEKEAWGKGRPARSVFKRLLAAPGRRLSRGAIQDDLWPNTEHFELADKNVYNAINQIRQVIGKPLVRTIETIYEIAGQSLVWVDLDACETWLKEAENQGCASIQALSLLEQVLAYLERGELLEGESGTWVYGLRKKSEDMLRQCRLWLAEGYEQQGKTWQAGEQYRTLCQSVPLSEEALQRWMGMLYRQGKMQEALKCYQNSKEFVEAQGFSLSPAIERTLAMLDNSSGMAIVSPVQMVKGIMERGIITSIQDLRGDMRFSPRVFLDSELLDRLERAFTAPGKLDNMTLNYLYSLVFEQKKQLVQGGGTSWPELLTTASNNLRLFTNFLESHSGADKQLTAIIGETCLLIGDVLFNTGDYQTAIRYYTMSLRAAQESRNTTLQAIAFGRYSLLLIDRQQSSQALLFIDEAIRLAEANASSVIRSWLWVVKGEVYASIGKEKLCLEALETSRELLERKEERETCYTFVAELTPFVYRASKLLGYEGACYLRLKQPEQARRVLLISQQSSSHPHHQSLVSADFAMALVQQKAPQDACVFAIQALNYIQQTHSTRAFQRVLSVRDSLAPWNDVSGVRDLDEQILLSRQLL